MPATQSPRQVRFTPQSENGNYQLIPIERLQPNPNQPRRIFDDTKDEEGRTSLQRLAASIKAQGILQPILVAPAAKGAFTIVAGERRFRAAGLCGLKALPCVVKVGLTPTAMIELALLENLVRDSLNPLDEARALQGLMSRCGLTQAAIGQRLGLSHPAISYKLSLLRLNPPLQRQVANGKLTATQGRIVVQEISRLTGPDGPIKQVRAMEEIQKDLSRTNGKLDTHRTQSLAKEAVDRVAGTAGSNGHAKRNGSPPTGQQKAEAAKFLEALDAIRKTLQPFEGIVKDQGRLEGFCKALMLACKQPDNLIESSAKVMATVHATVRRRTTGFHRN